MSIGKFSDIPHYLLKEYFQEIVLGIWSSGEGETYSQTKEQLPNGNSVITSGGPAGSIYDSYTPLQKHNYSDIHNSVLLGPKNLISATGGFWIRAFIKTNDEYLDTFLVPVDPLFSDNNINFFNFARGRTKSMINYPSNTVNWQSGQEVYLRKDSFFHDWYRKNIKGTTKDSFFNDQKMFNYFGKIYATDSKINDPIKAKTYAFIENLYGKKNSYFHIEHIGMDDWSLNALPENQRTDKMKELFYIYFDKIYSKIYNKTKDLWSNLDPIDIDINLLYYIAKSYLVPLDDNLSDSRKREFVRDIIYFLKRKGTYTSLYILWYLLTLGTINKFNVYERWHDWSINGNPEPNFIDHMYQSFYNVTTNVTGSENSKGAGIPVSYNAGKNVFGSSMIYNETDSYYGYWYDKKEYPFYIRKSLSSVPIDEFYSNTKTYSPSAAYQLSPHYRVEMDLSDQPLEFSYENDENIKIIGEDLINSLLNYWNMIKPVSRYVHYNYLLGLNTDLTGKNINNYSNPYVDVTKTKYLLGLSTLSQLSNTHYEKKIIGSTEWILNHNFNSYDIIIQCFNQNYERIVPKKIKPIDKNNVKLYWEYPIYGIGVVIKADKSINGMELNSEHNLNTTNLIVQTLNDVNIVQYPKKVELPDLNTINIDDDIIGNEKIFIKDVNGLGYINSYTIPASPYKITINHGLGNNVLFNVYNSSNILIHPDIITELPSGDLEMTFNNSYVGNLVTVMVYNADNNITFTGKNYTFEHNIGSEFITQVYEKDGLNWNYVPVSGSVLSNIKCDDEYNNVDISTNVYNTYKINVLKSDVVVYINSWKFEHNQNEKYQLSQYHDNNLNKFKPSTVLLKDNNNIIAVLSENSNITNGNISIVEYDYIWYQDDLSSTSNIPWELGPPEIKGQGPHGLGAKKIWTMKHNLGYLINIIQFFDENDKEIFPEKLTLVSENLTTAEFTKPIKGYALFKIVGNIDFNDQNINTIIKYQLGDGLTFDWDSSQNKLENKVIEGPIKNIREDEKYYYIDIRDISYKKINITEIGLFNSDDDMVFYTKTRPIFKPSDVDIFLHYKIKKLSF